MGTKLHCYLNKFAVAGVDWLLLLDHQASFVIVETQKESNPANTYLFKVNNRNTWKRCKICSKLTKKTPEQHHCLHSVAFIVNFLNYFLPFSSVSIVDFEQVNVFWNLLFTLNNKQTRTMTLTSEWVLHCQSIWTTFTHIYIKIWTQYAFRSFLDPIQLFSTKIIQDSLEELSVERLSLEDKSGNKMTFMEKFAKDATQYDHSVSTSRQQ